MSETHETRISRATHGSREEVAAWDAAAKRAGMSPHAWRRIVLGAAAGISDLMVQLRRVLADRDIAKRGAKHGE